MYAPRRLSPILLLCCGALVFLAGCASQPLVEKVNTQGRRIVLLLDASTSMRRNDPDEVAPLGAQLVAGLVGSEDNLGVITYSSSPVVRLPLRPAGNAISRRKILRALVGVERNGTTNFALAIEEARLMLAAAKAPRGSSVILVTDGVPYRGRRRAKWTEGPSLEEVLAAMAEQGWRIFAIALGKDASTPFLSQIVAKTSGAVFPVASADKLVAAFQEVATEALGYLRAKRGGQQAEVVPHTGRLAFLGTWTKPGQLGELKHDGKPLPEERVIRTPRGKARHAVSLVETPRAGSWSIEGGGADEVIALIEPRFSLEFLANKPPAKVGARGRVPIAVRLVGDPLALRKVGPRLLVRARLELNDKRYGRGRTLRRNRQQDGVYEGSFRAPFVNKVSSLRVVVEAVLVEGGRPFVMRRTRSLTVRPGDGVSAPKPLELTLSPTKVDVVAWAGDRLGRAAFEIKGDAKREVTVRCGRRSVKVAAGGTGTLRLRLPRRTGTLGFQAESEDEAEWALDVPVTVTTYQLRGPRKITLPAAPAGMAVGPVPFAYTVTPSAKLAVGACTLRGPGGATLRVTSAKGALSAKPAAELPLGTYRGTLPIRLRDVAGLRPLQVEVSFQLLQPIKPPQPVVLSGSWGWVSTTVEVAWPSANEVPMAIRPGALVAGKARITPDLDIRVRPMEGWSGKRLGAKPRKFALSIFLSSDLPAGSYRGSVAVRSSKTGSPRPLVIPIQLEVKR